MFKFTLLNAFSILLKLISKDYKQFLSDFENNKSDLNHFEITPKRVINLYESNAE